MLKSKTILLVATLGMFGSLAFGQSNLEDDERRLSPRVTTAPSSTTYHQRSTERTFVEPTSLFRKIINAIEYGFIEIVTIEGKDEFSFQRQDD